MAAVSSTALLPLLSPPHSLHKSISQKCIRTVTVYSAHCSQRFNMSRDESTHQSYIKVSLHTLFSWSCSLSINAPHCMFSGTTDRYFMIIYATPKSSSVNRGKDCFSLLQRKAPKQPLCGRTGPSQAQLGQLFSHYLLYSTMPSHTK